MNTNILVNIFSMTRVQASYNIISDSIVNLENNSVYEFKRRNSLNAMNMSAFSLTVHVISNLLGISINHIL